MARLSETAIAIARLYLCGIETAITFAGAKSVFFGAVFGRRGDGGFNGCCSGTRSGVVGFKVATLSRLVREKVRPAWPDVCVSAKKFALHAQNTPKSVFLRLLGELFRGNAAGGAVLGELFRGNAAEGAVLGEFFAPIGPAPRSCRRRGARGWLRWGFCSIRSWLAACCRRVVPLMTPFPRCVVLRLRREGVDASIVLFSAVGEADARRIW